MLALRAQVSSVAVVSPISILFTIAYLCLWIFRTRCSCCNIPTNNSFKMQRNLVYWSRIAARIFVGSLPILVSISLCAIFSFSILCSPLARSTQTRLLAFIYCSHWTDIHLHFVRPLNRMDAERFPSTSTGMMFSIHILDFSLPSIENKFTDLFYPPND